MKKPPEGGPMSDDITYRLNVNSVSRVYSVSLPATILYSKSTKLYTEKLHKFFVYNRQKSAGTVKPVPANALFKIIKTVFSENSREIAVAVV